MFIEQLTFANVPYNCSYLSTQSRSPINSPASTSDTLGDRLVLNAATMNSPAAKQGSLLWVNKSTQSNFLSRSELCEKSSIFSHVSRSRVSRRLRSAQECSSKSATKRLVGWRIKEATSDDHAESPAEDKTLELSANEAAGRVKKQNDQSAYIPKRGMKPYFLPSNLVDPFHTTVMDIDGQIYTMFQYFINSSNASLASSPWRVGGASTNPHTVIRYCLTSEILLAGLLSSVASRLEHLEGVNVAGGAGTFMQRALIILQRSLDSNPVITPQHIWVIMNLSAAEAYRFNIEGASTHLQAAKKLLLKTDRAPASYLTEARLLDKWETGVSAEEFIPPVFPCYYDPGYFSAATANEPLLFREPEPLDRFGKGLLNPIHLRLLEEKMQQMIKDLIQWSRVMSVLGTLSSENSDIVRWLTYWATNLQDKLLLASPKDLRGEALRLAVTMWISLVSNMPEATHILAHLAPQLQHVLRKVDHMKWHRYRYALLWILLVGAMSAEGSDYFSWFVQQVSYMAECYQLHSETQLRHFSECFLYLDLPQRSSLSRLAGALGAQSNDLMDDTSSGLYSESDRRNTASDSPI
jgi:hypothetical protein